MRKICAALLLVLCFAVVVIAAIAAGNHTSASDSSNVTTTGISTTGATLIFGAVATYSSGTNYSAASPTETLIALTVRGTSPYMQGWYINPPTGGASQTFNYNAGSSFPSLGVIAFTGTKASSPLDSQTGSTGSGTSYSPSLSSSSTSNVAIFACGFDGGSVSGVGASGYTVAEFINYSAGAHAGLAIGYKIGVSATENPTISWTGSVTWSCEFVEFKSNITTVARRSFLHPRTGTRQSR